MKASPKQNALAWKFQRTSPSMKSISDALKCFDDAMRLMKGEISADEFTSRTGHQPHKIGKGKDSG